MIAINAELELNQKIARLLDPREKSKQPMRRVIRAIREKPNHSLNRRHKEVLTKFNPIKPMWTSSFSHSSPLPILLPLIH